MKYEIINDNLPDFSGLAMHVRFEKPITVVEYENDIVGRDFIVSSTNVPFSGPETYIFPANEDGTIRSWGELPGSQRGVLDHETVIEAFIESVKDGMTVTF